VSGEFKDEFFLLYFANPFGAVGLELTNADLACRHELNGGGFNFIRVFSTTIN
jgi:hypothetical protein